MDTFKVERSYTVLSNYHLLKDPSIGLKAKGLLSVILSLPEGWDYTQRGLAMITGESVDLVGRCVRDLVKAGYIDARRLRDEKGRLTGTEYVVYEQPKGAVSDGVRARKGSHKDRFAIVSNRLIRDCRISLKAKGLLLVILALPEDWNFNVKGLSSFATDGIAAVRSGIGELEAANYLERVTIYANGRVKKRNYIIYEEPEVTEKETPKNRTFTPKTNRPKNACTSPKSENRTSALSRDDATQDELNEKCDSPILENRISENPRQENLMSEKPRQANRRVPNKEYNINTNPSKKDLSIYPTDYENVTMCGRKDRSMDRWDIEKRIRENICADTLGLTWGSEVDEIVSLMVDVVAGNRKQYSINGGTVDAREVRERFMILNQFHVDAVIDNFVKVKGTVKNVYAYLVAMLWNAPSTAFIGAGAGEEMDDECLDFQSGRS